MTDLRSRLRDLADSVDDWDDPLPQILRRDSAGAHQRAAATPRQPWTALLPAAAAVAAVLIVVAGLVALLRSGQNSSMSSSAVSRAAAGMAASTCDPIPTPSGPLATRVALTLVLPDTARSGEVVAGRVDTRVQGNAAVVITSSGPSVLIMSGGRVVGETPVTEIALTRLFPPGTSGAPVHVPMATCHDEQSLGPGRYELIAVLAYTSGAAQGDLVSAPVTVTVR